MDGLWNGVEHWVTCPTSFHYAYSFQILLLWQYCNRCAESAWDCVNLWDPHCFNLFTEILFWIGLLLSKEVKELKIIIIQHSVVNSLHPWMWVKQESFTIEVALRYRCITLTQYWKLKMTTHRSFLKYGFVTDAEERRFANCFHRVSLNKLSCNTTLLALVLIRLPAMFLFDVTISILKPVGGRGASVSACVGLTNQLLSCWVDPRIAWIKHWHSNYRRPVDGGGGTPRSVLLIGAKMSHLGCLISYELPIGFQNFVVINKIHPLKEKQSSGWSFIKRIYLLHQLCSGI